MSSPCFVFNSGTIPKPSRESALENWRNMSGPGQQALRKSLTFSLQNKSKIRKTKLPLLIMSTAENRIRAEEITSMAVGRLLLCWLPPRSPRPICNQGRENLLANSATNRAHTAPLTACPLGSWPGSQNEVEREAVGRNNEYEDTRGAELSCHNRAGNSSLPTRLWLRVKSD